jgi:hypothetical protein
MLATVSSNERPSLMNGSSSAMRYGVAWVRQATP